jgi:hypothetical protein
MATDADVVGTSEGITESLRRTRQMMSEVTRKQTIQSYSSVKFICSGYF